MKEQDITDELISREETSGYSFEEENSREEDVKILEEMIENANIENMDMNDCFGGEHIEAIEHILSDYKRVLKENETYKKQYFCLINRIENKIDKFDYEFEKAKRKNDNDRVNYYWDLIRNFKKLLESEDNNEII